MKRSKKTAGISLVALVVTIIVLIILTGAVIATFMEGGIIDRAKESVFKNDIRSYQEILLVKSAVNEIDLQTGNGTVTRLNATELVDIQAIIPEFKDEYRDLVAISEGELVLGARVTQSEDDMTDDEKQYRDWLLELGIGIGTEEETGITFTKISEGELAVGSEVKASNGEVFYVISTDSTKTNLLAKYNLKADGSSQDTSSATNICDPTSAKTKAKEYGELLGGTGRLMLKEEAETLEEAYYTIIYGTYKADDSLHYWLGSTTDSGLVYVVYGNSLFCITSVPEHVENYGVRPVIEVLTSEIK